MKKQLKFIALISLISLNLFVGCTYNNSSNHGKAIEESKSANLQPTPSAVKSPYKNGTFTSKSQVTKRGQEEAVVTIKNGKISAITLKVLDTSGKEINYSLYTGQMINDTYYPNINQYRVDFAKAIINKQSTNIPDIKEIPEISSNWKTCVNDALTQAKQSKNK